MLNIKSDCVASLTLLLLLILVLILLLLRCHLRSPSSLSLCPSAVSLLTRPTTTTMPAMAKKKEENMYIKETESPRPPVYLTSAKIVSSLEYTTHPIMHIHRFYDVPNGNHRASKNFQTATIIIFSFSSSFASALALVLLCTVQSVRATGYTVVFDTIYHLSVSRDVDKAETFKI